MMILSVLAAGCMVGPNYKRPTGGAAGWLQVAGDQRDARLVAPEWWRLYREPELDRLVANGQPIRTQTLKQAVAGRGSGSRPGGGGRQLSLPDHFVRSQLRTPAHSSRRATAPSPASRWRAAPRSTTGWRRVDLSYEIDMWVVSGDRSIRKGAQAVASADDEAMVRLTCKPTWRSSTTTFDRSTPDRNLRGRT